MTDVTGLAHRTSDQHVELGSTRCNRDVGDFNTILKWLAQNNPFDIQRPKLTSLSSGLTASDGDGVNCDEVEEVGLLLDENLMKSNITKHLLNALRNSVLLFTWQKESRSIKRRCMLNHSFCFRVACSPSRKMRRHNTLLMVWPHSAPSISVQTLWHAQAQ